jgi:hypothetical protein
LIELWPWTAAPRSPSFLGSRSNNRRAIASLIKTDFPINHHTPMTEELFPEKPSPDWVVLPIHVRQTREEMAKKKPLVIKHYELLFRGKIHLKRKGEHGLRILKEMAAHMNLHGMVPREKVECLADVGLPAMKRTSNAERPTSNGEGEEPAPQA